MSDDLIAVDTAPILKNQFSHFALLRSGNPGHRQSASTTLLVGGRLLVWLCWLVSAGGVTAQVVRPIPIPGRIEAENYDTNRAGISYDDATPGNSGGVYRTDDVDIETCNDLAPTLGFDVGWLDPGDWMKYSATIPPGPFAFTARVASATGGGQLHVEVGGSNVTGVINVPSTGGWQSWNTISPREFTNAVAANAFKAVIDNGGFNLHWLQFTSLLPAAPTGLVATASSTLVSLNWSGVSGASGYKVKRAATSGGTYATIATNAASTNFTDTTITNGTTVYYVVTASNAYGESIPSNEARVAVPFPRLTASVLSPNVLLSWSNPASFMLLRSATSLIPPVAWLPVTNAPVYQSGVWQIFWTPEDPHRFFQLSNP